jgi:hypothetical protein
VLKNQLKKSSFLVLPVFVPNFRYVG